MRTFNLSVMPRRSRLYKFMFYSVLFAEYIERMFSAVFNFHCERKLRAVIRLNDFRSISEKRDSAPNEIDCTVGVLFPIRINEPFASCFVDYSVLIKSFVVYNRIGYRFFRNAFNVHLHFLAYMYGSVIRFRLIRRIFLLRIVKPAFP